MKKILSLFAAVLFASSMLAEYTKVTAIEQLSDGDKVVVAMGTTNPETGVTGWNNNKDATVSTTEADWVQYEVSNASASGWYLYDSEASTYIASPSTNEFKYGTAAVCSVNSDNVLTCNDRSLYQNSTNYRMYGSNAEKDKLVPFYVWKVGEGGDTTDPVDPTPDPVDPDQPTGNTITDVLNRDFTGITANSSSYSDWTKDAPASTAIYVGNSLGGNNSIQLRASDLTKQAAAGIVTTASGGKLVSITITYNSETVSTRKLDIYASNTAYTAVSDLYDNATTGTKVASLIMSDGATQTYTFTEDYEYIGFRSNSNALYLDEVQIVWALESGEVVVARPTFEPAATDFVDNVEVTLAAEEGAAIYYTLNGDQPTTSSTLYAAPFTLTETTTVKAIAVKEGVESAVAEKTYTKLEVLTCAEFAALADGESGMLGEVVVTYVNGSNTYLKDETGALLLYAYNFGLKAGDVVTGIKGKMSPFSGLPELVPTVTLADLSVTAGEAPAPEDMTIAPTTADLSKYVVFKGVTVAEEAFTAKGDKTTMSVSGTDVVLFNQWAFTQTFEASKKYDVVGVVTLYSDNTQIYFISAEEVVDTATTTLDNVETATKVVKTIENGQLIIRKGTHTYNAQGMLLK